MIKAWTDGSIRKNPGGDMGIGIVVKDYKGMTWEHSEYIPIGKYGITDTSCNVAECLAMMKLFGYIIQVVPKGESIVIHADSEIMVNQLLRPNKKVTTSGAYVSHINDLKDMYLVMRDKWDIKFQWIPREQNKEADKLSTKYYKK